MKGKNHYQHLIIVSFLEYFLYVVYHVTNVGKGHGLLKNCDYKDMYVIFFYSSNLNVILGS